MTYFETLANDLRDVQPSYDDWAEYEVWLDCVDAVATGCQELADNMPDNIHFDRLRFKADCGA